MFSTEEFNHNIHYTGKLYTEKVKALKAPMLYILFYFNAIIIVFS